jgi:2-(1,2-epoxy-1,2-dihydrophenyl)acetyl-CoA isomerase
MSLILEEMRDHGVLILTLNRPEKLNALNVEMEDVFMDALRRARDTEAVRAVVIAGSGDRAFCAGYDVVETSERSNVEYRLTNLRQNWWWGEISTFPKPMVTANHAITMGWGAITSVSADIRVGCEETVFKFTASPYGGANATWNLPQLIGWSRAKDLLMTSRPMHGPEAFQAGLLNRLVPKAEVRQTAIEVAEGMAKFPETGVRAIKRLILDGAGKNQTDMLRAETEFQQLWFEEHGNGYGEWFKKFIKKDS